MKPLTTMAVGAVVLALGYGAVFLDEGVGASALIGLALILAGVTLGTRRAVRAPRPATAPA